MKSPGIDDIREGIPLPRGVRHGRAAAYRRGGAEQRVQGGRSAARVYKGARAQPMDAHCRATKNTMAALATATLVLAGVAGWLYASVYAADA